MKPERLQLNRSKLNRPREELINGVKMNVLMSPYDVPEEVSGDFNEARDRFVIKFCYIGREDEKLVWKGVDEHVRLGLGRHSKRLYEIEVDVRSLNVEDVGLQILVPKIVEKRLDDATNRLGELRENITRRNNYDLAKEVIVDNKDQLFSPLGAK